MDSDALNYRGLQFMTSYLHDVYFICSPGPGQVRGESYYSGVQHGAHRQSLVLVNSVRQKHFLQEKCFLRRPLHAFDSLNSIAQNG